MKYITYAIFLSLVFNITWQKHCHPYSKLNSDEYSQLFPVLNEQFKNTSIIQAMQKFQSQPQFNKNGNAQVKMLKVRSKRGQEYNLVFKRVELVKKDMFILEEEMEFQLRVQGSKYVPKLWGCFGDQSNMANQNKRVYYIVQEALNFDLAQDEYVYINGRPKLNENTIKKQLNLKQRLEFYKHLFLALVDFKNLNVVHNDIKPQNIMTGAKGYKSYPYIIDYGLSQTNQDKPIDSTKCYEYKGKNFVKKSTPKFDVYSMGVSVMDFEVSYELFCGYITNHQVYKDSYDTMSITLDQVLLFEQRIMNILQIKTMKPKVSKVQDCNNLGCVLLFTMQRYINKIPEPEDVVEALQKLIDNQEDQIPGKKLML